MERCLPRVCWVITKGSDTHGLYYAYLFFSWILGSRHQGVQLFFTPPSTGFISQRDWLDIKAKNLFVVSQSVPIFGIEYNKGAQFEQRLRYRSSNSFRSFCPQIFQSSVLCFAGPGVLIDFLTPSAAPVSKRLHVKLGPREEPVQSHD